MKMMTLKSDYHQFCGKTETDVFNDQVDNVGYLSSTGFFYDDFKQDCLWL